MTEENVPGSEYANVSANNISSWCTSSRGAIFAREADVEQCKVSDIPSRYSETNNNNNNNNINNNKNTSKTIWSFYMIFGIEQAVWGKISDRRTGCLRKEKWQEDRLFLSPSAESTIHYKSTESIADVAND
jgi:hypothetical protein